MGGSGRFLDLQVRDTESEGGTVTAVTTDTEVGPRTGTGVRGPGNPWQTTPAWVPTGTPRDDIPISKSVGESFLVPPPSGE